MSERFKENGEEEEFKNSGISNADNYMIIT